LGKLSEPGNGGHCAAPFSEPPSAGISIISQESPLFQELAGVSAVVAAGMVGIVSIGKRLWPRFLGLGVRLHHEARSLSGDVSSASVPLLDTS